MIGDPGVGKTAIAEGLAHMIVENKVPEVLKDHTILFCWCRIIDSRF